MRKHRLCQFFGKTRPSPKRRGSQPPSTPGRLRTPERISEPRRQLRNRLAIKVMTITYWHVGRRLVEQEQQGAARAGYGERLLKRLSLDLSKRFGRGCSERNLEQMRAFYLGWTISQAASAKTLPPPTAERKSYISQTVSAKLTDMPSWPAHSRFPLPWSHGRQEINQALIGQSVVACVREFLPEPTLPHFFRRRGMQLRVKISLRNRRGRMLSLRILTTRSSRSSGSVTPRTRRVPSSTPISKVPPDVFAKAITVRSTPSVEDKSRLNSSVLPSGKLEKLSQVHSSELYSEVH
jgi:hypothetical protein